MTGESFVTQFLTNEPLILGFFIFNTANFIRKMNNRIL
jgi:hypothetical protein